MRVLVGDTWRDGFLDEHREPEQFRIDVEVWIALAPVREVYFEPPRDWRRVAQYVREFGVARTFHKVRSRLREAARNERFLCAGVGRVREGDLAGAFPPGQRVAFVAPCHPRGAERVCLPGELLRREHETLSTLVGAEGHLRHVVTSGPLDDAGERVAGWHARSGAPLEASDVDAVLDEAARRASDAVTTFSGVPTGSDVVTRVPARGASSGRRRAIVFGLGHYAKSNLIPNLASGIEVCEVREIDPLQLGRIAVEPAPWTVSTDPHLRETDRFDLVCVAGYHDTHADLAIAALRAGARVLVEKPLVTTREQLEALLAVEREHPGRLFTCFHKRYNPLNELAMRDLGVARGEAVNYQAIVFEVPLPRRHWYRWPTARSRVVSNGCHWIDHFLLLNAWARPRSHAASLAANGDITLCIELENGAAATIVLTDHGSARLGVQDYVELRARDVTVSIRNGAYYAADSSRGVIRRKRLNQADAYARMYRNLSGRVLSGEAGDSTESIERSAGLMLDLEDDLAASRSGRRPRED
jgi:predicted dehydrogenase